MNFNSTPSFKGKTFDQIHDEYAERYGVKWLNMNCALVSAAESAGFDVTTTQNKLLITIMAARSLDIVYNEVLAATTR